MEACVLLLESDATRCAELTVALRIRGIEVLGVTRIAEVERWPQGQIVVTSPQFFTMWWRTVGATHIVLMADAPEEGIAAVRVGAAAWVPRHCTPGALASAVRHLLGNAT